MVNIFGGKSKNTFTITATSKRRDLLIATTILPNSPEKWRHNGEFNISVPKNTQKSKFSHKEAIHFPERKKINMTKRKQSFKCNSGYCKPKKT